MRVSASAILSAAAAAVVIAAIIGGLSLIGSPAHERMRRLDEQRIADLRGIASAVDRYWTRHGSLPSSLDVLAKERDVSIKLMDPESKQEYGYRADGTKGFTLCANFAQSSPDDQNMHRDNFWSHGPGPHCFELVPRDIKR